MKVFTRLCYLVLMITISITSVQSQIGIIEPFEERFLKGWTDQYFFLYSFPCQGNGAVSSEISSCTRPNSLESKDYNSNGNEITYYFEYYATEDINSDSLDGMVHIMYSIDNGINWVIIDSIHVTDDIPCSSFSKVIPAGEVPNDSYFRIKISAISRVLLSSWVLGIDNILVTQKITTKPACTSLWNPFDEDEDVDEDTELSWKVALGATGYILNVGTTSGGTDILNKNVGNVTSYPLYSLPYDTEIFVSVIPYNSFGVTQTCLEESFKTQHQPPPNDDCEDAIPLSLSADQHCDQAISGTTKYSTADDNYNCGFSEVWYTFTPTVTDEYEFRRTIPNRFSDNLRISLWEGTCNSMTQLNESCSDTIINRLLLTAGKTYLVSVSNGFTSFSYPFDLCVFVSPDPPINDDCLNATPIYTSSEPSCEHAVSGTTEFATAYSTTYCALKRPIVWYSFTPTSSNKYQFTYNITKGKNASIILAENYCDSIIRIVGDCYTHVLRDVPLIANKTYLVGISSNSPVDFDLCISLIPSNNDCSNAIDIPISNNSECNKAIVGTNHYATNTINNSCNSIPEVWYKYGPYFPSSGLNEINITLSNNTNDAYITVWEGSCGALTLHSSSCDLDSISSLFLNHDSTYYICISAYAQVDFELCLSPSPPPNDDCKDAIPLTQSVDDACSNGIGGTLIGANFSSYSYDSIDLDVWYSFTPTTSGNYFFISYYNPAAFVRLTVWEGNCDSLIRYYGLNGTGTDFKFEAHVTYYLRMSGTFAHSFGLCVYKAPPPPNDDCHNATPFIHISDDITCQNHTVRDSFSGATSSAYSNSWVDIWYSFYVPNDGYYSIKNLLYEYDPQLITIYLYEGDCDSLRIIGDDYNNVEIDAYLLANETYYIQAATRASSYNLMVQLCVHPRRPPRTNYDCTRAIDIKMSSDKTCSNTEFGTLYGKHYNNNYPCDGFSGPVAWYKFTPSTTQHYTIDKFRSSYFETRFLHIWKGTCDNVVVYDTLDFSCSSLGGNYINLFQADSTYFICIAQGSPLWKIGPGAEFDLCIYPTPAPINDDCTTAINIWNGRSPTISNGQYYNEANATPSSAPPPSCNTIGKVNDLWFSLDDLVPGHEMTVTVSGHSWNGFDPVLVLYEKNCDQLKEITCLNSTNISDTEVLTFKVPLALFQGSDPSPSYLIRVYNKFEKLTPETFKITASIKVDPSYYSQLTSTILPTFNLLTWNKAHHDGTGDYILEKSIDGQHFKKIGTISNHTDASNYQFRDEHPDLESFYRLKSFDSDGSVIYSDIHYVIREDYHAQKVLNVYPVPTLDILQVQVASTEATDATLEILDLSGKVLHLENLRLEKGTYDYELDLSGLDNGSYIGRMNDQVFKVVVQK